MEQDGCGCTVPKSSPIPPRLPGAPAAAQKALFVLPHPPGRGREMPSAVNHPALLGVHPSLPCRCLGAGRRAGTSVPGSPGTGAGGHRGMCCPSPQGSTPPNPAPSQLCPAPEHRPPRGCSARTVPGDVLGNFGVPQAYSRVRSLFQAWQLMGSSRKLW